MRPGPGGWSGFTLAAVLWVAAAVTAHGDTVPRDDLGARAREIQNTCFALYPPEMLARMAADGGAPPDEVRNDPARQQKYLKTEDVVEKGLFYPALLEDVLPALRARAGDGVRFLDLGSGDGRVVFLAALTGAHATGIEYDRTLHRIARRCRKRLEKMLPLERIELRRGDFFEEDWGRFDVIFYFVDGSFNQTGIQQKLLEELRDDALLLLYHPQEPFPGLQEVAAHGDVKVLRRAR
jgi:SAM-dependent methyltransferase